jgi:glycosyltransferase involved in cell wall biosynthesis
VIEVSVIVPVFDHKGELNRCLAALAAQTFPRERFEVIIVDNGPAEGSAARLADLAKALAEFPHAHALHQPSPGSYAARNLGLSVATGDVLAFTDDDCVPQPDWLACGVAYLHEHPDVDAAAGAIEIFTLDHARRTGAELYELRHGFQQEKYVETAGFGATANLFARRSAFDHVGPFDATLKSGGDKEWGHRAKAAGLTMLFDPAIRVRHPARRSLTELRTKIYRVADGDVVLRQRRGWSRLNWVRYSVQPLRPPLRTIWRARHDADITSSSEWRRYGATYLAVRWITAYSRVRRLSRWRSTRAGTAAN